MGRVQGLSHPNVAPISIFEGRYLALLLRILSLKNQMKLLRGKKKFLQKACEKRGPWNVLATPL